MAEYENIDIDFAKRTLKILKQYDQTRQTREESFEVTLLINCLVGLLVLPQKHRLDLIPDILVEDLKEWNIDPEFIKDWGTMKEGEIKNLRQLVRRLRNSVAHFQIAAESTQTNIERLQFSDSNGFQASIPVDKLRVFVTKFAETISSNDGAP